VKLRRYTKEAQVDAYLDELCWAKGANEQSFGLLLRPSALGARNHDILRQSRVQRCGLALLELYSLFMEANRVLLIDLIAIARYIVL